MKKTHIICSQHGPGPVPHSGRGDEASQGYRCELLENCGSQVCELGLKYVHNDTCYPALLVIGQFWMRWAPGNMIWTTLP